MITRLRKPLVLLLSMLIALHAFAPHELVLCFVDSGDGALEHGRSGRCLGAALPEGGACTAQPEPAAAAALDVATAGCLDLVLATLDARRPECSVQASAAAAVATASAPPAPCALRLLPLPILAPHCAANYSYDYASRLLTTSLRI